MDRKMTRYRQARIQPRLILGLAIATSASVIALGVSAQTSDNSCARQEAGSPVRAEFDIPAYDVMTTVIPRFGRAPELEAVDGPFHVVVFDVHRGIPVIGQFREEGMPSEYRNVVCVITPDGQPSYYVDIDLANLALPDGE
jgi:hypothetical protein